MVPEGHICMLLHVSKVLGLPPASPSSKLESLLWWKGWMIQSPIFFLHSCGAELKPKRTQCHGAHMGRFFSSSEHVCVKESGHVSVSTMHWGDYWHHRALASEGAQEVGACAVFSDKRRHLTKKDRHPEKKWSMWYPRKETSWFYSHRLWLILDAEPNRLEDSWQVFTCIWLA